MKSNLPSGLNYRTFPFHLSTPAFLNLVLEGVVCDGRAGGLVIGRSFEEGGIFVVQQRGTDFMVHAMTEGGEYVLNKDASCRHLKRIQAIDSGTAKVATLPPLEAVQQILITHAEPDSKLLWVNWNQTVVRAEAVKVHMDELVGMNEPENPFTVCCIDDLFPAEVEGTEDGVI